APPATHPSPSTPHPSTLTLVPPEPPHSPHLVPLPTNSRTSLSKPVPTKPPHDHDVINHLHKDHHDGDEDSVYFAHCVDKRGVSDLPWYAKKRVRHFISTDKFHTVIIGMVVFDLVIVFIELIIAILSSCTPKYEEGSHSIPTTSESSLDQISTEAGIASTTSPSCTPPFAETAALEDGKLFLFALSVAILFLFTVEISVNVYARGWRIFVRSWVSILDAVVVVASLAMELGFRFSGLEQSGVGGAIVVLRVWKIVRAMHAVAHSIEMRNQHVIRAIRHATRSTNAVTANLIKVYAIQRREFLRLNDQLSRLQSKSPDLADADISAKMAVVFDTVDDQLERMKKQVEIVQDEEMHELVDVLREVELDDDDDREQAAVRKEMIEVQVPPQQ
ncbi:hypothetical protein HDU93_001273, partial [Gonapodya sp. JEL0774]